jgi:hypothetical protein
MRAIDGSVIDIPAVPPLPTHTPLPEEAMELIRALIAPFNAEVERQNAEQEALYRARNWNWFRPHPLVDESAAVDCFLKLVNGEDDVNPLSAMMRNKTWEQKALHDLFSRPDFTHLLRLVRTQMHNARSVLDAVDGTFGSLPGRNLRSRLDRARRRPHGRRLCARTASRPAYRSPPPTAAPSCRQTRSAPACRRARRRPL